MKIKVLIVEDEEVLRNLLVEKIANHLRKMSLTPHFEQCKRIVGSERILEDYRPHIVTLDLKDEINDDNMAGKPAWDFIRDRHFCPVVFYSANPLPEGFPDGTDPFARYLNKNEKEPADVAATIESFIPHVRGLDGIRAEVESRYARALQKVSSLIWSSESSPEARTEALLRVTRRRLAATLEHPIGDEKYIKAWEQFIYPPIEEHLCTGDVLLEHGVESSLASSYRVILTPPCDLVPGQNPVPMVLLGRCSSVIDAEVFRRAGIAINVSPTTKLAEKLAKDEVVGMKLIPKLSGIWPTMVLDFKSLELVPREAVALSPESVGVGFKYKRIASLDSPFRESLSWRFMQTAGRPGTPQSDKTALEAEIKVAR
jgi:hypothetical protein